MTILPKKKTNQEKRGPESGENHQHHAHSSHSGHGHSHSSHSANTEVRNGARPKSRNSPPRWPPNSGREGHDSRTNYEGHERMETSHHSGSKRARHRSSPHRHERASMSWMHPRTSREAENPGERASGSSRVEGSSREEADEYNSGDEYDTGMMTEAEYEERERRFEKQLQKTNFIIKKMCPDGACLFRSVADQVYGDQEWHSIVRAHCMDYMVKNCDYFSQYITEDFDTYIARKRTDNCHGNHVEMQALSEMYNRNVEVYVYSTEPINTFHTINATDNEPLRLSYHRNIHYNSVVNPHKATIGVGLGMPSFVPGLADKSLMRDALQTSEKCELEQAMLEDKKKATDWEATNDAIQEQVARESYIQWLKDNEQRVRKKNLLPAATCSSAPPDSPPAWWGEAAAAKPLSPNNSAPTAHRGHSPRHRSGANSGPNSPDRPDGPRKGSSQPPSPRPIPENNNTTMHSNNVTGMHFP